MITATTTDRAVHGTRYGIAQYRYPLSFVLAGKTLSLTGADASTARMEFTDRERMTFTRDGQAEVSVYQCLPVAEDVYLVSFEVAARFAVIDLARGRVLLIEVDADTETAYAIDGHAAPDQLGIALTDEMTGTAVRWTLGDGRHLSFEYLSDHESRQSWSPRPDRVHTLPTRYYSLGEGLFVVIAKTAAPPGIDLPQGLNRLVMVQDFAKVVLGGAALSVVFNERVLFSGYGTFLDPS